MNQKEIQTQKTTKKLPLSSDIVFKRVFAKEENKELLKSLLKGILNIQIENVEVQNPEIPRDLVDSKAGTLDIKAKLNDNVIVDVELQVKNEQNIDDRSIYYLVKTSSNELKKGKDYTELNKTIVINLLDFNYFKRNSYHNIAHMRFEETTKEAYVDLGYKEEDKIVTNKLEMHFLELPKFRKKNPNADKLLNQWLWLISGEEEKVKMAKKENKEVKKAIEVIDEMSMDPKEWELYESREKAIMNYNSGMKSAERRGMEKRTKKAEWRNGKKERNRATE